MQAKFQSSAGAQSTSTKGVNRPSAPSQTSSTASGSLQAWDNDVMPLVSSFNAASQTLGPEVSLFQPKHKRCNRASCACQALQSTLKAVHLACRLPKQVRSCTAPSRCVLSSAQRKQSYTQASFPVLASEASMFCSLLAPVQPHRWTLPHTGCFSMGQGGIPCQSIVASCSGDTC